MTEAKHPPCPHCGHSKLKNHKPGRLICRECGKTCKVEAAGPAPVAAFKVQATSTLQDADGNIKLQWVKESRDHAAEQAAMAVAAAAFAEDLPRAKPVPAPHITNDQLAAVYVLTDYHLGMLSWGDETGADWDIDIAEDTLVSWFAAAIAAAPTAELAVFANIGDFLHWDGMDAVTPASKHILDADTRFQKLVRVAIRAQRRIIAMLLEKHQRVHVINAEGNHDPASSIWLREWLSSVYEDEPRVTVDTSADPYYCVEHGDVSLFFHHGHKRKMEQVSDVLVAKFRAVFGRTKHSYAHTGHLHHDRVREDNLMTVEQHRTLAAPDAYASRGGWMSGRGAKVIVYHKQHGEVARLTINPEMLA